MRTKIHQIKSIILLIMISSLFGCIGYEIRTTNFHGQDHEARGTISAIPINVQQEDSLEFRTISNYALSKFAEVGYTPIMPSKDNKPSYVFFMTYGIDDGTIKYETVPVYGMRKGRESRTSGSFSDGTSFDATTYEMPTYGVVGSKTSSRKSHKRIVNINVYNVEQSKPFKVYEMKGININNSGCSNIHFTHIETILDGMFEDFPGENGKVNRTTITHDMPLQC
jgi:hypothetical protein